MIISRAELVEWRSLAAAAKIELHSTLVDPEFGCPRGNFAPNREVGNPRKYENDLVETQRQSILIQSVAVQD
ncbi:MAG: hypothetical protein AAGG44_11525, partial [Planctomycetota bacterium]